MKYFNEENKKKIVERGCNNGIEEGYLKVNALAVTYLRV